MTRTYSCTSRVFARWTSCGMHFRIFASWIVTILLGHRLVDNIVATAVLRSFTVKESLKKKQR